jgi:hypothetical protein
VLLQVVVLEIGGWDLDAEVFLAVFTGPTVAQQRQQGADLAALVAEVNAVGEEAAVLGAEPADRLEVVCQYRRQQTAAVKGFPFRTRVAGSGLQEGADRVICRVEVPLLERSKKSPGGRGRPVRPPMRPRDRAGVPRPAG